LMLVSAFTSPILSSARLASSIPTSNGRRSEPGTRKPSTGCQRSREVEAKRLMQMELTIETETGGQANMEGEAGNKTRAFRDAQREQTSILAPLERAALYGFARRMPAWVNSDHLSVLGLIGMIGAGACYALSKHNPLMLHLVNVFIFLNWFGDSLDGTLARYRDRQRPRCGFYL